VANTIKKFGYVGKRRKAMLLLKQDVLNRGWYIQLEVLNTSCSLQERLADPPLLIKQACGNPNQTDWLCGEGHPPMLLLKQGSLTKIWSIQPEVLSKNCSLQAWFAEPLLLVEQACG